MNYLHKKSISYALVLGILILTPFKLNATDTSFVTGVLQDAEVHGDNVLPTRGMPFPDVRAYRGKGPFTNNVRLESKARVPVTNRKGGAPVEGEPAHFVYSSRDTQKDIEDQRAVNAFTSVYGPFKLTEGDLTYLSDRYPRNPIFMNALIKWKEQNGWKAIYIEPNDTSDLDNAYYWRNEEGKRQIVFFMMSSEESWVIPGKISTADGADVPAHEAGHAILDLLWQELFDQESTAAGGIHEAWGDLTAIFYALHQRSLCEALYQDTGGDLHGANFLNRMAEEFGENLGEKNGLRFVEEDIHIKDAKGEVHAASLVLTGAIWDIMKGALNQLRREVDRGYRSDLDQDTVLRYTANPSEMLFDVGQYLRRMLVESVLRVEKAKGTFSEFGRSLHFVTSNRADMFNPVMTQLHWGELIKSEFERRGIWHEDPNIAENERILEKRLNMDADKFSICHTLGKCSDRLKKKARAEAFVEHEFEVDEEVSVPLRKRKVAEKRKAGGASISTKPRSKKKSKKLGQKPKLTVAQLDAERENRMLRRAQHRFDQEQDAVKKKRYVKPTKGQDKSHSKKKRKKSSKK